jgi:succinoglycan biosynthesis transport protein ExoP
MSVLSDSVLADEPELGLRDYWDILRHRFWLLVVPLVLVSALGTAIAVGLPPVYRSSAKILVESQQIPTQLVQSMVSTFAEERIQVIKQRVMTRENVLSIIRKFDLYEDKNLSVTDMTDRFRQSVFVNTISTRAGREASTIAFTVAFEHRERSMAQKVANELVTLFLNENAEARTKRATETTEFLVQEADKLSDQIQQIEQQIADYKQQFSDSLPENLSLNIGSLERARSDLRDLDRDIRATREQKNFFEVELSTLRASPARADGRQGNPVLSSADQLLLLYNELTALEAELTPSHPDVKGVKSRIASFQAKLESSGTRDEVQMALDLAQRELDRLSERYTDQHPDVQQQQAHLDALTAQLEQLPEGTSQSLTKPPGYREIEARIQAMDGRLQTFAEQRSGLVEQIKDLERRIEKTPQVERGFQSLARDYENATAKYREVRNKQMEAQLAQNLEEDRKAERFSLLEPPGYPGRPEKPNRPVILLASLVLGVGVGGGSIFVAEQLDRGVRNSAQLDALLDEPVLVTIPYLVTAEEEARRRRRKWLLFAAVVLAVTLSLVAVQFFYRPIDEVVMAVLRRFGLG